MLSKMKVVHGRGEDELNPDNTLLVSENCNFKRDHSKVVKKVFFDTTQVEEFLSSEYFRKEEVWNLGCWDICSTHNSQEICSKSNGSSGCRPITALALMLIGQFSSLPRSRKIR